MMNRNVKIVLKTPNNCSNDSLIGCSISSCWGDEYVYSSKSHSILCMVGPCCFLIHWSRILSGFWWEMLSQFPFTFVFFNSIQCLIFKVECWYEFLKLINLLLFESTDQTCSLETSGIPGRLDLFAPYLTLALLEVRQLILYQNMGVSFIDWFHVLIIFWIWTLNLWYFLILI